MSPVEAEEREPEAPPRVLAPSVVALSMAGRARVTSFHISGPNDGVTVKGAADGWETAYAPRCRVAKQRVAAALDGLQGLVGGKTEQRIASGNDFVLKIVVYGGNEKLLKLALGPNTQRGVLVQLDDGSTLGINWR